MKKRVLFLVALCAMLATNFSLFAQRDGGGGYQYKAISEVSYNSGTNTITIETVCSSMQGEECTTPGSAFKASFPLPF